jgi:putative ABC transport system ATP-binding protein
MKRDVASKISPHTYDAPLVELRDVCKTYRTNAGDVEALKYIRTTIARGAFVGVIGRSGAGKSTLLNMITAVDSLTRGEILIDGIAIHTMNVDQTSLWRGKNIGVVYQSFELLNQLTVLDNVMLPMDFTGGYRPGRSRHRAMELLTQVEIQEHAHKPPTKVSGGQQQRVAIARALANDPPIIVADEPTGSLDSITSQNIIRIFKECVRRGTTVIMATHDTTLAPHFTHILHLRDGMLAHDVRRSPQAARHG